MEFLKEFLNDIVLDAYQVLCLQLSSSSLASLQQAVILVSQWSPSRPTHHRQLHKWGDQHKYLACLSHKVGGFLCCVWVTMEIIGNSPGKRGEV